MSAQQPDDDPFATGGHGRFMNEGAAPPVIGAPGPVDDGMDETWKADPRSLRHEEPQLPPTRPRMEPATTPLPVLQAPAPARKSFLARLFRR